MPAEKIPGLLPLEKLPHRPAPGMTQIRDPVEHGPMRRDVANRNHRLQTVKLVQPLLQLFLRVLAGRIERRRIRVAETNHVEPADLDSPAVKIVQPEAAAQIRNLLRRFVIARDHVHPITALLQNLAHGIQTARKVDQIPRAEVIIGLDRHQPVERPRIAVDIGKHQQFHGFILQFAYYN